MERNITIRPATLADAPVIAKVVAMAVGEELMQEKCGPQYLEMLTEIAQMDNTQYSYRNALVAEVDDKVAGAIVGYDGARLYELRKPTFEVIARYAGQEPTIGDETGPGEFYLDSIAILPQFRGMGIGGKLLTALRDKALAQGHERTGLLVDFANPKAEALYHTLGFKRVDIKDFMGHDMWHLQYP